MMNASILIVDDDVASGRLLEVMTQGWGVDTQVVRCAEDALDQMREQSFDIVISDIRMPGMSGHELLTEIREISPGTPVILLTAHGSIESAVEAMKQGALDYVIKPAKEEELKLTVERALEYSQLRRENLFLRANLGSMGAFEGRMLGRDPGMLKVFDLIRRVAVTDGTILISGETGTGKELVAQTIHFKSRRADQPFIACNCGALHANLLESELFGHEEGAFTGATTMRRGRFEEAHGGTIFLDEIGETTPEFQVKLLRVLQEKEIERVGGSQKIQVDARVLASTNRDLAEEVREGRFREDLFYRLRVIPIHIPPLRERRDDILLLAEHFLRQYNERYDRSIQGFSEAALAYLNTQDWPGNVRELQHVIERAVILANEDQLDVQDLTIDSDPAAGTSSDTTLQAHLDQSTQKYILQVLDSTGWRKKKAAEILGIDRATLYRMIKKYSIRKR